MSTETARAPQVALCDATIRIGQAIHRCQLPAGRVHDEHEADIGARCNPPGLMGSASEIEAEATILWEAKVAPKPELEKRCEGFAWIGQSLQHCDRCGKPAWEHSGKERLKEGAGLMFGRDDDSWEVVPWGPGQRTAMAARYGVAHTEETQPPETVRSGSCD